MFALFSVNQTVDNATVFGLQTAWLAANVGRAWLRLLCDISFPFPHKNTCSSAPETFLLPLDVLSTQSYLEMERELGNKDHNLKLGDAGSREQVLALEFHRISCLPQSKS